jgi:metal-responsive CopG/Arc/MetJ family transcriptional regulator
MNRTTISLPDSLAARLKDEARRRRTSVSDVVRDALAEHLGVNRPRRVAFAGIINSASRNSASDVDAALVAEDWADHIERDSGLR